MGVPKGGGGKGGGRDIDPAHAEHVLARRLARALDGPEPADERPPPAPPRRPPPERPTPPLRASRLAFDDDQRRARRARPPAVEPTPGFDDAVRALLEERPGGADQAPAELFPSAPSHGHPDLPPAALRPPAFLTPLEAMKDVYLRVKGRASRKTTELLEGVDLEDLLRLARRPFEIETKGSTSSARLPAPLRRALGSDPGPLLLGLDDPRLTELWRLFVDGWDLWLPDGRDEGVELFWEGEADDDGRPLEILQSLALVEGEVVLTTRLGALEDEVVFDGEGFYRLATRRPIPREAR